MIGTTMMKELDTLNENDIAKLVVDNAVKLWLKLRSYNLN